MKNSDLKILAIITMLIDHIGAILYPELIILRIIGRISFPIFAFLIAEGYIHTSNFKKYITRIFFFALISQIPFSYALTGTFFSLNNTNVLFTFTIALMLLYIADSQQPLWLKTIAYIILFYVSIYCNVDYSVFGILMVLTFYKYRDEALKKYLLIIAINSIMIGYFIYFYQFDFISLTQFFAIFSIPFIASYNGKKGLNIKYLFYAFYPLHLLILGMIKYY